MRRFLLFALPVVLMLVILVSSAGLTLAHVGPFHPGDALFPLQAFTEQKRALLILNPTDRALYYLNLLERRNNDLSAVTGTEDESAALDALDEFLDLSIDALANVPLADLSYLKVRMMALLGDIELTLLPLSVVPSESPGVVDELLAKITTLIAMLAAPQQAQDQSSQLPLNSAAIDAMATAAVEFGAQGVDQNAIDPQTVDFPPGSPGAEHEFFPLSGKHALISCQSCHEMGQYAGTPDQCTDCHLDELPDQHFEGQCSTCHLSTIWTEINFDHSLAQEKDCLTCHTQDKPARHYKGICSACHTVSAWKPASFDHQAAGATDCQSCHKDDRPANHFSGQCSACHSPTNWRNATFNHQAAGATDCQSCHKKDRPANHFSGQCSACHSPTNWRNATFNHQAAGATDCQSCHKDDRPANHFNGQCSACHNTTNWGNATFNHQAAGATDCQSCHANDRPGNHSSGQCSACHNTSNWGDATFNHSATGATDCKSCHTSPSDHWSGQCSQCHNTNGWGNVKVNGHRFPMDHGDADGNCSSCHNGNKSFVNCYDCHNRAKMEEHHAEDGIFDIAGRCLECHPTGDKEDD